MLTDVGAVADFEDSVMRTVSASGRELTIVRWEERFYAIRNICPHMGARLSGGSVSPRIVCAHPLEPAEVDHDRPVLLCPWHGWTFDLFTGESFYDGTRHRLRSYPIVVEGDRLLVDTGAGSHAAARSPSAPNPRE